mmetsp:Transcript_16551/g.20606  ORF Transcript_16551/g.20606 Transcript_16551/m.20606 type:complete len:273 (+) Transcript_16551:80-898(+)|eukprot:CAMPEP_0172497350 /NCGR_PEP_ID=MMETSP1066-20121228/98632_1 /TAXON_ID=671091 /ORGANISM="Coscinodiscus wailesii, Strain CCMP2513" /LENGTH=272 /DNA_ID=CAMNT_0013270057 /DNA_START=69 /DNA_END=887 /DNA_ORIENTATION=-
MPPSAEAQSLPPPPPPLQIVLPGDDVTKQILTSTTTTAGKTKSQSPKIGTGLRHDPATKSVVATRSGQFYARSSNNNNASYFVRSNRRRYVPEKEDNVIGIVEDRFMGEYYRVNIFGPHPALLHNVAFEGATKRNRPSLHPGTLIYARVSKTDRDLDPELSCKVGSDNGGASRKDWMTDEGTYGELKGGGMDFRVSLGLARELLKPGNVVLNCLGERIAFEVAIGVNGVVWCNATTNEEVILICNAIKNSEVMTDSQVKKMVNELLERIEKK